MHPCLFWESHFACSSFAKLKKKTTVSKKLTFSPDSQAKDLHMEPWNELSGAYGLCVSSSTWTCIVARGQPEKTNGRRQDHSVLGSAANKTKRIHLTPPPARAASRRPETPIRHRNRWANPPDVPRETRDMEMEESPRTIHV